MNPTTETTTTIETTTAPVEAPKAKAPAKKAPAAKSAKAKAPAKVKVTGKVGALQISGTGTIAELSEVLSAKAEKTWENPTTTALVNGLVLMGMARKVGNMPSEGKKGRTASIYEFTATVNK